MDWRMVTDRAACPYQSAKPRWTDPAEAILAAHGIAGANRWCARSGLGCRDLDTNKKLTLPPASLPLIGFMLVAIDRQPDQLREWPA